MRQHDQRVGRLLATAPVAAEGEVVERSADGGVEVCEPRARERDTERVAAGARERVALVAADPHAPTGDPRCLGREARLRTRPAVDGERAPRRRPVASHREEHDHGGHRGPEDPAEPPAAALRAGRRWTEVDAFLVLDELTEAEVRVLRPRPDPRRGAPWRLAAPADHVLHLGREQEHDRHPDRNPRTDVVAEEPCHDDDERCGPHGGLDGRAVGVLPHARRVGGEQHYDCPVIDPLERWRALGLPDKPDYAGLLTFAGMPYTQDPAELTGVDVAVVGAPTDDLVSDRPGTRFGPRAIRAASCPTGPHLEARVDWADVLRVVDFGDAPVIPADPLGSRASIEALVRQVVEADVVPIVLGGDHSVAEPDIRAVASRHGAVGLVHFDTHTDTGTEVFGIEVSHGTPMYRLVRDGHVDPGRYVQIGLRGYWPGERELGWQREQGITSFFMHDVRELGIDAILERTTTILGDAPTFLSVDVDVLDPAFAPGTGTPEPGGMTPADLLRACRVLASRLRVVGMDVVEVIPTAVGSADVTALVAERVVREVLTGLALRQVSVSDFGRTPGTDASRGPPVSG